jgi:dihydroorotase
MAIRGELAIENAELVVENQIIGEDLLIEKGRIKKIGGVFNAVKRLDCRKLTVLPGCVDVHVHFRDFKEAYKEDWCSGSKAALHGGVTTVLDMPNNKPPICTVTRLQEKRKHVARHASIHYGFHFGATHQLSEMAHAENIASFKLFMSESYGDFSVEDERVLEDVFQLAAKQEVILTVHAEDSDVLKEAAKAAEKEPVPKHSEIRPPEAEIRAVKHALKLRHKYGGHLHFCHISTAEGLRLIVNAKKHADHSITCEVTPHHLFLTQEDESRLGNLGKMNPPLRTQHDQQALWRGIDAGNVDCIATDHAPHTLNEKNLPYWKAPAGVPGIETALPLLLDAVIKDKLTLTKLAELYARNPAKIFGIPERGIIAEGMLADLVIVNLDKEQLLQNGNLYTKCGWTPFDGLRVTGTVEFTLLAGKVCFKQGEVVGGVKAREITFVKP